MTLKRIVNLLLISLFAQCAYAKAEKWYRVEMIIFDMGDKTSLVDDVINHGQPSTANAIILNDDPNEEYSLLSDKQLSLTDAKKRIQKRYHLVMHKGWRQTITDKDHAQKVRLIGGKDLAGEFEVDGIVRLSLGRNLNVETDLLFKNENRQAYRIKESSRLRADEISYIDNPKYGILVMVTPEKGQAAEKPQVIQAAPQPAKVNTAPAVTDDSPIFPKKSGFTKPTA